MTLFYTYFIFFFLFLSIKKSNLGNKSKAITSIFGLSSSIKRSLSELKKEKYN